MYLKEDTRYLVQSMINNGLSHRDIYECVMLAKEPAERALLLAEFYSSMRTDKVRIHFPLIETEQQYLLLDDLERNFGLCIDEVEAKQYPNGYYWRYTFDHFRLSSAEFKKLLVRHVKWDINVCAYFNPKANNVFCFNIDLEKRLAAEAGILNDPLYDEALRYSAAIGSVLELYGIKPFVYPSGHGMHLWVRLDSPISNEKIDDFMSKIIVMADYVYGKERGGIIHCYKYPAINNYDASIRLFGTRHIYTRTFTHLLEYENRRQLAEYPESWTLFKKYMEENTIAAKDFENIYTQVKEKFGDK